MGVAVTISADPRSEPDHRRQFSGPDLPAVNGSKIPGRLGVEICDCREQGDRIVVEPHGNLILYGRLPPPHFVRLPEARDLRQDLFLTLFSLGIGKGESVKALQ